MPLFKWKCPECGSTTRMLLPQVPEGKPKCPNCPDILMEPDHGGSTSVMESLDNGIMVRKVERYRDIEELRHSHAELTKPKDDGIV